MKTYVCTRNVNHDNEAYEKDDEIELDDKHAEPLLEVGAIVDPSAPAVKTAKAAKKVVKAKA